MSRAIGSWIILNIFLASCRGRFFRTTFGTMKQWWWFLILSCISSWLLAAFPLITKITGIAAFTYTQLTEIQWWWWRFFLIMALICIPTVIYLLLGKAPKKSTIRLTMQLLILLGGITLSFIFTPRINFTSRVLIAVIEERTKTSTSLALNDRFNILSSDIIYFWLISALGFAFMENAIYLWQLWATTVSAAAGIVIKRTLTSWIMHMCYTGLIAVGFTDLIDEPKRRIRWIGLIISGILLHTIFNTTLGTTHVGITLALILFWYLFMSWLIYKSERVYI